MRPPGEIHQALLRAAAELATPQQAPTLAEMATHAQVGMLAARRTLDNMRRSGAMRIVRTRRVAYRNRPVAEYAPPPPAPAATANSEPATAGLCRVLGTWAQG
jgi:hypothetical protein